VGTWVCLLRGVNVGGHNRLPMPDLRVALAEVGFGDVRTYVQSGNNVLDSPARARAEVAGAVGAVIEQRFGLTVPVVVRTPAQLRKVLAWDPFPEVSGTEPKRVNVIHLMAEPDRDRVAGLLAEDVGPDAIAVRGEEAVVHYRVNIHGSRITGDWLARRLGVEGTARNWRTLGELVTMTSG